MQQRRTRRRCDRTGGGGKVCAVQSLIHKRHTVQPLPSKPTAARELFLRIEKNLRSTVPCRPSSRLAGGAWLRPRDLRRPTFSRQSCRLLSPPAPFTFVCYSGAKSRSCRLFSCLRRKSPKLECESEFESWGIKRRGILPRLRPSVAKSAVHGFVGILQPHGRPEKARP